MTACGPFVNMKLLVELLPQVHPMSTYRYNTAKAKGKRLPKPDLDIGGVSVWEVDTIQAWADRAGLTLDPDVLSRICQTQGVESDHEV